MKDLKITLVQPNVFWEQREKNLDHLSELLYTMKKNAADLIIIPEMFSTGFSMNAAELAEEMNGESMQWMARTAKEKNAIVCGSLIIKEKSSYYNRLIWMRVDGSFQQYDKRHLFQMAQEQKTYTAGKTRIITECKGWRICPLICYDLRFPAWSRNMISEDKYDVLIYVASWPNARAYAWKQLLIARAIENQCYVAGVNRIGKDGSGYKYSGDSAVIDPWGEKTSVIKSGKEGIDTVTLSAKKLSMLRESFPVLLDGDDFEIK